MEAYLGSPAMREESREMWNLNKRLEAYLSRVQSLEEENELLRAEIEHLQGSQAQRSWRNQFEVEVSAMRDAVNERFSEKAQVELERDCLFDEIQQVKAQCQRERQAQEDAKKELAENKKALEDERRAQMWLKEKAHQLELELEALVEVHEADMAELEQEMENFSQSMENFRVAPVAYQPVDIEDYSQRLSAVWKGAVETYKSEVTSLEGTLAESKEKLHQVTDENRQNQAQLQSLEKELSSLKARKVMLEERLSREWHDQQEDVEKFQLDMDSLEQEKQDLRTQIAHVLEDRQQLMHLKMSLSLEVATYRTLLEAESTRMLMPYIDSKPPSPFRESQLEFSSSPIQALSSDARKYTPKAARYSSSAFQKVETKSSMQRNQHTFPPVKMSTLSKSPLSVTVQTPKVSQVLKSQNIKSTHASAPPKSVPEPKGKTVNLSAPISEEVVTNIKVEAVSKSKLSGLITPIDRPSVELESDVSKDDKKVTDLHIDQKTEERSDKVTHQEGLKEVNREEPLKDPTDKDHFDETQSLNEDVALQEAVYSNELLTETLEDTGVKMEVDAELLEPKIYVANTEASLPKAMGATFDIPSNLDESYGTRLPHLESPSKEMEKQVETEKEIEIGQQASIEVSREAFYEPIKQQEEPANETEVAEPIDIKDTHEEHTEHSLVEQNIYEETQESVVPSAGHGIKDKTGDIEVSQCQNKELKMLSKENEEISDLIVEQVESGLKACPEDELDGQKVSRDEEDIPKDAQGSSEESYRLETFAEAKETRAFQMTEDENMRELASAAEDTEDYDAVSDVQESMFFNKTESLSTEDAELTEVMPNEILEHAVADQLMPEGGEREEDMLTDTEDFTEDQEIDNGMEVITEHEIQSVRTSENFSVNENITEPENKDLFEDDVEGDVNTIHDDLWKHENFGVAENILQDANLNEEGSRLESETVHAKEIASEQESLSHENLEDNERILSLETVGEKHDKDLMSQEGPLVTESELVSKTESESMHSITQPLDNDPSQGLTISDDFLISSEKMQWGNAQESKIDLDLSDEIPNDESEELQMENVTEHREFDKDITFDQDLVVSEVPMGQNESEQKDMKNDVLSRESSCKEISEAEVEVLGETQIVEEHKVEVSKDIEGEEVTEKQECVKSWTSVTDIYQMQSEFLDFGDSDAAQLEFSEESTESQMCIVNKQELEHSKEYSLQETLPDTSVLPHYDEETETSDLEMQESLELLTQVSKETDIIKVDDQAQQEESLYDNELSKNVVQTDVAEDFLGMNEQPEDLNIVSLPPKQTSNQDVIKDESFICPEPNQEEENILDHQEAKIQEELVSSTHRPNAYQMQSEYSESEDFIDSQNAFLQDSSQSETVNAAMQKLENTNDYPLDNNSPDTALTLNHEDETEALALERQLPLEMLTQVNEEGDIILGEQNQVEQILSVEEIPVSLEATQVQIGSTLSEIVAETEKEIAEAGISFVESAEKQEENKGQEPDSKDHGFADDGEEKRVSAYGQEVGDEVPECETSTTAGIILKQDEELFEETHDTSLENPKDLIEEEAVLKAGQMSAVYQERFDYEETEAEEWATEIPTGSSLTLTQDESHFHNIIDESTEQKEEAIERSEALKVSETTHVYQEMHESDVTETCKLESELISNTVTLSREEDRHSEDIGVELLEQTENIIDVSDVLKESGLKEIHHEKFPLGEREAQELESEMPSAADTVSTQAEEQFDDESRVQEDAVIEESEDLKASYVRNLDQENVADGSTECQEIESERASIAAQLSMQNDVIEDAAAEPVVYSEKVLEEKEGDKVTEMLDALHEKCENDERDDERITSETITDTVRMSMEDYRVSEDVSEAAPEFTESATDEGKVLASEQSEIYQEQFDNENFEHKLESDQNVTIRKFDSVHIPRDAFGAGFESILEQVNTEVVEHQNVSALITSDNKSEPDNENQKPEIFQSDSEDSILSDEESPNVTKTPDHSEHEVIMSSGTDLTRVSSEKENIDVPLSTESKELEYQQEIVAQQYAEQVLISSKDVLPVSDIDDLCKDIGYPTQGEEWLSDQLPETADESVESIDVLVGESEIESTEERFVIKHENFLLTPMQFTSESHILEENSAGLNGFHSTLDIDDPSTFRKEMLNGHSSVDESQEIDLITQESQEHLENDFKGQLHSDLSPKTVLIHEAYAEETFSFPKSDESQKLFQKLLGASNQQETSSIEEDHVHTSEEEPTSDDDQNGNANSSPNPFTQGNNWDDQLKQASKKASFEDAHSLFETDQPSKDTIDNISGLKSLHNIDDAWSSDDD